MADEKQHHLFHHSKEGEEEVNYETEEKHHNHHERLGELGALAVGAYAMHEKYEAKKDPEHTHEHKIKEEIVASIAIGSGVMPFHEHHEKKEDKREDEQAHGKKHHRIFYDRSIIIWDHCVGQCVVLVTDPEFGHNKLGII